MGGKKKKGGGKEGSEDDKYDPGQMQLILAAQVQSLKERLSSEQERRDQSISSVEEIRETEQEMLVKIEGIRNSTQEIVKQMTESYTKMQEKHLADINMQYQEISQQKEMIKEKQLQLMKSKMDKAKQIDEWNEEIVGLKKQINEAASDFEARLKETVVKLF